MGNEKFIANTQHKTMATNKAKIQQTKSKK